MATDTSCGHTPSALGERLIAILVVAAAVLGVGAGYPALADDAKQTASRAQARADLPLTLLAVVEEDSAASNPAPAAPPASAAQASAASVPRP